PPLRDDSVAIEYDELRVGIADIDGKQHRRPPLSRATQQLAGHDLARAGGGIQQQGALAVHPGEPAAYQPLAQSHIASQAERPRLGEPDRPDRLKALAPPLPEAGRQRRSEPLPP